MLGGPCRNLPPHAYTYIYIKIPYLHKQVFNFIAMRFSACANIVNARHPSRAAINMYSLSESLTKSSLATNSIPLWPFACVGVCEGGYAAAAAGASLGLFLMHLNPLRGACKCERQKSAADASAENERKRIKSSPPTRFAEIQSHNIYIQTHGRSSEYTFKLHSNASLCNLYMYAPKTKGAQAFSLHCRLLAVNRLSDLGKVD